MQTPPPFGYERATSVEHAVTLLERLGPEARLVAGGHSLLPMMKLRLARPEHLVDINDLAEQLGYIRVEGGELVHRGADPSRPVARLRRGRRALPHLPRRRAGHRRSRRAQPRHRRRFDRPSRPERGPLCRLRRAAGDDRDPGNRRHPHRARPRVPRRALRDCRRAGGDDHRDPCSDPPRRGFGVSQGRAPGRRLGGRRGGRLHLARRRHRQRGRDRAHRGRGRAVLLPRRRGLAARRTRPPTRRSPRRRRSPPSTARRVPTSAARRSTSATSPAS